MEKRETTLWKKRRYIRKISRIECKEDIKNGNTFLLKVKEGNFVLNKMVVWKEMAWGCWDAGVLGGSVVVSAFLPSAQVRIPTP